MDLPASPPHLHKRTHHQMSSSTPPPSRWIFNHPEPSGHTSPSAFHLNLPLFRYAGDGLDCRRPVMSAPTQEVIDLTEDASTEVETQLHRTSLSSRYPAPTTHRHGRLPRLTHEVISIDEFDEPTEASVNTQRSGSPEIELLYARPRFPTHRLAPPSTLADWRDRLARGQQPQDHHAAEGMMAGMARHIREESLVHLPHGRLLQHNIGLDEDMMFVADGPQINLPGHLDFMRQGFDMGNVPRPPPPPPTYDAPSPPREGYTRSPKEDDVLICPNCDEELGSGQSDMKKQVWVARKCGHVYCGECTKHRQNLGRPKSARVGLPKPFAKCVVEKCDNRVSHGRSFFQVFL